MRARRVLATLLSAAFAWAGATAHTDGLGLLSHGTFFFAPDHGPHAPFVPEKEHPCVACAVSAPAAPEARPGFLLPPEIGPSHEVDEAPVPSNPVLPELPARSPPPASA